MRALVLITYSILLTACSTPRTITSAPSAIILAEDLRFNWVPPNLGRKMEVFISADRYTKSVEEQDTAYYESEAGLVSRAYAGQPAQKAKGGIGFFKEKGQYFVWAFAPSIVAQTPWTLISGMTQPGPLVRIYLGKVPVENESSLQFER